MERADFTSSGMAADAVVRNLEVIGLRHRIVHDYFGVDLDLIWAIMHRDLPDFTSRIANMETRPNR